MKVIVLGGALDKRAGITCGAAAAEAASGISADHYLLVVAGVHPKEGLTVSHLEEAAFKRILAGRAADTYVLASVEKIGTVAPYTFAGLSRVAGIVTDAPADHPTIRELRQQGVNIIQAP